MPGMRVNIHCIRRWLACAVLAAAVAVPAIARAQVVVIANGSPITELDVKQREKLIASSTHKHPSRKEVIDQLIDDRLKIAKAKTYGLVVSDAEIDQAFNTMAQRQGVSPDQFKQFLARSGVTPYAVKQRIRAELTWGQMIRGKFAASLKVTDADIERTMRARNEGSTEMGYVYTLYPVMIVVPSGSSQSVLAEKHREAENLRSRFTTCSQGLALARELRDVAVREPVTRSSGDLPKALRDLLDKLPLGHLTTADVTAQGLQMFALCDKKQTTQDLPMKTKLREEIFAKRYQAASRSFLEELRRSAWIEYKK